MIALTEASMVMVIVAISTLVGVLLNAVFQFFGQRTAANAVVKAATFAAHAASQAEAVNKAVNNVQPDDPMSDLTLRQLVVSHEQRLVKLAETVDSILEAVTNPNGTPS